MISRVLKQLFSIMRTQSIYYVYSDTNLARPLRRIHGDMMMRNIPLNSAI